MSEWKTYRLSDFAEINPKVKLDKDKEYPFVEMKDLNEGEKIVLSKEKRKLKGGSRFENNDTLFARITPCLENGKICQVKSLEGGKGFGSTEFIVLRGKQNISDTNFVFYLSRWQEVRSFAEQNMVGTSGRQRVSKDALDNLELSLPSLPEQKSIASILSSLDDKIELNNRINKNLEDLVFAFFEKLNTGEAKLKLDDFIDLNPRISLKNGQIVKYLGMVDVPESGMSVSGFVNREFSSGSKFQRHDTLLARITPCLENGKTAFVNFLDDEEVAFGSTEFIVMRAKKGVSPYFVYALARNSDFRQFAIVSMTGTSGRQRVQTDRLIDYEMPEISDKEMEQFHNTVEPLFKKIQQNREEISYLTELRDLLLPKLMSGELTISQAEKLTA